MSSQATSRVARNRLGARERAQAARGLTGSQRVSESVAEEDTPTGRPRAISNSRPQLTRQKPEQRPRQACALGSKGISISIPSRAMTVAGKTARASRSSSDVSREYRAET